MKAIVAAIAVAFVFGSCARQDWIDRTLVTVDVTGTWQGRTAAPGAGLVVGDMYLDVAQQGSTVRGTMHLRGSSSVNKLEPIEGTVAGDVFRFKTPRGTLEAELTVSGDEMPGTAQTLGGRRTISFRRAEPAAPLAPK